MGDVAVERCEHLRRTACGVVDRVRALDADRGSGDRRADRGERRVADGTGVASVRRVARVNRTCEGEDDEHEDEEQPDCATRVGMREPPETRLYHERIR